MTELWPYIPEGKLTAPEVNHPGDGKKGKADFIHNSPVDQHKQDQWCGQQTKDHKCDERPPGPVELLQKSQIQNLGKKNERDDRPNGCIGIQGKPIEQTGEGEPFRIVHAFQKKEQTEDQEERRQVCFQSPPGGHQMPGRYGSEKEQKERETVLHGPSGNSKKGNQAQ